MGKTPKPLVILVHPQIGEWEEVQKLAQQGHTVVVPYDLQIATVKFDDVDLILHPKAWRMDTAHRKYVPLAIAAGRKLRYPKGDR